MLLLIIIMIFRKLRNIYNSCSLGMSNTNELLLDKFIYINARYYILYVLCCIHIGRCFILTYISFLFVSIIVTAVVVK